MNHFLLADGVPGGTIVIFTIVMLLVVLVVTFLVYAAAQSYLSQH